MQEQQSKEAMKKVVLLRVFLGGRKGTAKKGERQTMFGSQQVFYCLPNEQGGRSRPAANMVNIAVLSLAIGTFHMPARRRWAIKMHFLFGSEIYSAGKTEEGTQNANFYSIFALRDLQFSNFPRAEK